MLGDSYGIAPDMGKDIEHETVLEIDNRKYLISWGSYKDILIPENKIFIDAYIIDAPEKLRKKYGDSGILERCVENARN